MDQDFNLLKATSVILVNFLIRLNSGLIYTEFGRKFIDLQKMAHLLYLNDLLSIYNLLKLS
jgi:hypothetical protein